jgi:hypothetical protein
MRSFIITLLVIFAFLTACQKTKYLTYQSNDNVYFNFKDDSTTDRDSVVYTFAFTPEKLSDTILLPIRISGNRVHKTRQYKVAIVQSGTTAVAGTHYVPLLSSYTIPADSGSSILPLIVYNKDTNLTRKAVALNLQLTATDDLQTQFTGLINARIIISNKLQMPSWWHLWMTNYTDTKYRLFIIATGVTELAHGTDYGLYAPQSLYFIGLMNNLILDPVSWVANNPGKGYALQARPDGNYDFYNKATPVQTILVKVDASTSSYHFIDENGSFVTPN